VVAVLEFLPGEIKNVFDRAKTLDPSLNEQDFLTQITLEWLECYRVRPVSLPKDKVELCNNLKKIIESSGRQQKEIAKTIGINPSYLSDIVRGKYDPSIKIVLLLMEILSFPPAKLHEMFYLTPAN
jgi:DNA-binding XRE family transcriptional regulator